MKKVVLLTFAVFFMIFSFAQDAAEKLNQANEALKAKDYAKAFTLYDEAMSNIGDVQVDVSINYNIGFAAYKAENLEGAVKYFDIAIEAGTNVSKCHEYKALAYNKVKDYINAVGSFKQAIKTSEGDTKALVYNAAIAAYRGNLLDDAVALFGQSVENSYKGETALYYKAVVLNKQKKSDEYKATLEEGAVKFPGDSKISPALAKIYFAEGHELYKKGAEILTTANSNVEGGSMSTADDDYKAEVAKAKEEFKLAIVVLEKAKILDPTNANVENVLSACKQSL